MGSLEIVERDHERRLTRREALRATVVAGVAVASARLVFAQAKARRSGPRVAIVGAGAAGLVTAFELKKAGVRADLFEAGKRTGGRIISASGLVAPGVVSELGGEFIDSDHKTMLGLVKEFGLELLDMHRDPDRKRFDQTYFFQGAHHSEAQVVAAFRPFADEIARDVIADAEKFRAVENAEKLDHLSMAEYLDDLGLDGGWLRALLDVAFTAEFGLDSDEMSALNFLTQVSADLSDGWLQMYGDSNERYRVRGGNRQVTAALTERLPDQIQYEHRLEAVQPGMGGGYWLTFAGPGSNARRIEADFVILTVPFSVLRRQVTLGVTLPPRKARAIAELGYGTNAKLIAGFQGRPWRMQRCSGAIFSDEAFQSGWDSSLLQTPADGPSALTLFLGGQAGREAGKRTADETFETLRPGVERAFPGVQAAFNGRVDRFHWPTAPFALGSYACYKPGQWTAFAGVEGKPVGNLFFAGEHCIFGDSGYMESAVVSGRRAARGVLAKIAAG
jgi:monoamine oxidase